jgi:ribonucleoside-triphosphate reductase
MAVNFLKRANVPFTEVFADKDPELAEKFGIKQAPTLVVTKNGKTELVPNVSNIKAFAENYTEA